jgi:DnaJ-class molecular chaperone
MGKKLSSERSAVLTSELLGKSHAHKVERYEPQVCPKCHGDGVEPDTGQEYGIGNCNLCEGEGEV